MSENEVEVTVEVESEEVAVEATPAPAPVQSPPAKLGLKETNEILDALELISQTVVKSLADGKIGVDDLVNLADLARNLDVLMAGVRNADDAVAELKDLDETELLTLVVRVFGIVKGIAKSNIIKGL